MIIFLNSLRLKIPFMHKKWNNWLLLLPYSIVEYSQHESWRYNCRYVTTIIMIANFLPFVLQYTSRIHWVGP